MQDKIYCDYIYSDSLEFSFNDFKTYDFNTTEPFRFRLKSNDRVKDSIPFYKITKKNDMVFEIKKYQRTNSYQRPNRKLKAGRCILQELIFNNGHVTQMNEKIQVYPNRNYRKTTHHLYYIQPYTPSITKIN